MFSFRSGIILAQRLLHNILYHCSLQVLLRLGKVSANGWASEVLSAQINHVHTSGTLFTDSFGHIDKAIGSLHGLAGCNLTAGVGEFVVFPNADRFSALLRVLVDEHPLPIPLPIGPAPAEHIPIGISLDAIPMRGKRSIDIQISSVLGPIEISHCPARHRSIHRLALGPASGDGTNRGGNIRSPPRPKAKTTISISLIADEVTLVDFTARHPLRPFSMPLGGVPLARVRVKNSLPSTLGPTTQLLLLGIVPGSHVRQRRGY
mmetsp:Transcript_6864/g.19194  ORF Transcript_6864/g.19194 Transcript_6864/m.19194 type:complete len:262 (-) Transcript_6864:2377-3162(-)